jgi:hypothetical protein
LTQLVTIRKRQGEFEIRSIESDLRALEIQKEPSGSSNEFRIDVGLLRNRLEPGPLTGTIRVHTSDKDFPTLTIQVRGKVQ